MKMRLASLTCMLIVALAAPAAADAYKPDAQVEVPTGFAVVGANVFSVDGSGQTAKMNMRPRAALPFTFYLANYGTSDDQFWVSGCGSNGHFKVTYRAQDATDLTYSVTNGVYLSNTVSASGSTWIFGQIKTTRRAQRGERLSCPLTLSSENAAVSDTARIKVTVR